MTLRALTTKTKSILLQILLQNYSKFVKNNKHLTFLNTYCVTNVIRSMYIVYDQTIRFCLDYTEQQTFS